MSLTAQTRAERIPAKADYKEGGEDIMERVKHCGTIVDPSQRNGSTIGNVIEVRGRENCHGNVDGNVKNKDGDDHMKSINTSLNYNYKRNNSINNIGNQEGK